MEALYATTTGLLAACGVYLTLRGRTFPVVVGLTLLSYAVNLFLFSMGGLAMHGNPAVVGAGSPAADPLPQALVLTAIVISFGMTAVLVLIALGAFLESGDDQVNVEDKTTGEGDA